MKTYISVCKQTIQRNLKNGTNVPALRISRGKHGKPSRRHTISIPIEKGKVSVVYDSKNPMPWGARAWVEVEEQLT